MPQVRLRTVDAFTDRPFTGNPAAVLVLDRAPSDQWMASVAREINLSETAFVIREELPDADFRLRWFTPTVEVDLCGPRLSPPLTACSTMARRSRPGSPPEAVC